MMLPTGIHPTPPFLFMLCLLSETFFSSFKDFIYLFLEKGREGEREGEKHQCVVASRTPPTEDVAYNPGMCPDRELNQRSFGSQVGTQSTEAYQPGLKHSFYLSLPGKLLLIVFSSVQAPSHRESVSEPPGCIKLTHWLS